MTAPSLAPAVTSRLPGLDGLRAISIVLVILFHLWLGPDLPKWSWLTPIVCHGRYGVTIFFAISGFLITWLLLCEEQKHRQISIKQFYFRRAFRILPAAFFYLGIIALLKIIAHAQVTYRDLLESAFFVRNIFPGWSNYTEHFWSLSVEEQFYLFWPFFIFLIRSNKWRIGITIALICLAPCWRFIFPILSEGRWINAARFDYQYDNLLMGCLLALLRFRYGPNFRFGTTPFRKTSAILIAATAVCFIVYFGRDHASFPIIRDTVSVFFVAIIINETTGGPNTFIDTLLNLPPVAWIGRLSYSLYLWHVLFLTGASHNPSWYQHMPYNILAMLLAAAASFYFVEQPMLALRERLGKKAPKTAPKLEPATTSP